MTVEATSPIQYLIQLWHGRLNVYGTISTLTINSILIQLPHKFVFHIDHNSEMGTSIIGFIFNSNKDSLR